MGAHQPTGTSLCQPQLIHKLKTREVRVLQAGTPPYRLKEMFSVLARSEIASRLPAACQPHRRVRGRVERHVPYMPALDVTHQASPWASPPPPPQASAARSTMPRPIGFRQAPTALPTTRES